MSAMFASVACLVSAGDHIVASAAMFSSCHVVLTEILPKWGVTVELVKGNDSAVWAAALSKPTKVVFIESPSNPLMEIVDIRMVSDLAHKVGATVIVDNVMASPILQKPLALGADVVMYSATKHIDGQGRVLAGAVLGSFSYIHEYLIPFTRHTGPSLSPFNAWVLSKSLELLDLRMQKHSENAMALAEALEGHKALNNVKYPYLKSHPQYELAKRQMKYGGGILTLDIKGGFEKVVAFSKLLKIASISPNLGDSRTIIPHPASTTHSKLPAE